MSDRSWRLRVIYTASLLGVYFIFFFISSFLPAWMAKPLFANSPVTMAMLWAAGLIAGSVALTAAYMFSADQVS
jgi:uncharacterized membrane protein (DUF485 family)